MADSVKALTHWRGGRTLVRSEHTREVVRQELPESAQAVLLKLASELDRERVERETDRARIRRLESVIARLAIEAAREDRNG